MLLSVEVPGPNGGWRGENGGVRAKSRKKVVED
jgi:hypothetical protein